MQDKEMEPIYVDTNRNVTIFKRKDLRFKNMYQYSMFYDVGGNKICWGFMAEGVNLIKEDLESIILIVLSFIQNYWLGSGITKSLKEEEAKQKIESHINKIIKERRLLNYS